MCTYEKGGECLRKSFAYKPKAPASLECLKVAKCICLGIILTSIMQLLGVVTKMTSIR